MAEPVRCWPTTDPLYIAYHDEEWGRPDVDERSLYEKLVLEGFQSGLSWITILRKRPAFRAAFAGFDPGRVAAFGDEDVARLLADAGIVRNRRKIEATIYNARVMWDLIQEYGSFHAYLRSLDGSEYAARRQELSRRFKNLGPTGVFTFLWCVNEEVPDWEDRKK